MLMLKPTVCSDAFTTYKLPASLSIQYFFSSPFFCHPEYYMLTVYCVKDTVLSLQIIRLLSI